MRFAPSGSIAAQHFGRCGVCPMTCRCRCSKLPPRASSRTRMRGRCLHMPLPEQVVADYQTIRLSLKGHPMEFLRADVCQEKASSPARTSAMQRDKQCVRCAGVVLVRQRPGSAKGVVFMTLEDETGIANIVVWPKVMERYRKEVMGARLILVEGYIQSSPEQVTHLVAQRLFDRSHDLVGLANDALSRKHAVPAGPALIEPLQRRPARSSGQSRAENPPSAQRPHPSEAFAGFSEIRARSRTAKGRVSAKWGDRFSRKDRDSSKDGPGARMIQLVQNHAPGRFQVLSGRKKAARRRRTPRCPENQSVPGIPYDLHSRRAHFKAWE